MINIELQEYLHDHIPLSSAMGIMVTLASTDQIILKAPLAPNINHKKTVFGGSLHSVATLSCWSLVFMNLRRYSIQAEIVISNSEIKYLAPITADFDAICRIPRASDMDRFIQTLRKKGKARIRLTSQINQGNKLAVDYAGEFVAIVTSGHSIYN